MNTASKRRFLRMLGIYVILLALIFFLIPFKEIAEKKARATVSITFDTEYPYGVPQDIMDDISNKISEKQWLSALYEINNISEQQNVSFQFNVVGKTAEDYAESIKMLSERNGISCHTYSHLHQKNLSYAEKENEAKKCKEAVENIIGKKVLGNRFPYTEYDNESFDVLSKQEYKWDSSVWKESKLMLKPYLIGNLTEFPVFPVTDDWKYFIYQNKNNASEFYDILEKDILELKNKDIVYVIILHPWVLSINWERISGLKTFIENLKKENIRIETLDNIYKRLNK